MKFPPSTHFPPLRCRNLKPWKKQTSRKKMVCIWPLPKMGRFSSINPIGNTVREGDVTLVIPPLSEGWGGGPKSRVCNRPICESQHRTFDTPNTAMCQSRYTDT